MERPAGQAPVGDNDEYGGDVVDGVGVGGVDDNEAPVAISNNDDYAYIQKGGSRGSRNPQTILNFPQKDCLRTRNVSRLHCLQSY